jgi:hypothetical protein
MRRSLAISILVALGMMGHSMTAVGQSTSGKDLLNAVIDEDVGAAQIQALLSRGADIDARDEAGRTALLIATHGNRIEVARALIEAGAVLVNGPPQPMLLAADADDDLIEMSFVSWCGQTPADLVGKALAEFQRPLPHCLMADQDTAGGQHLLDHAQAQGEPEVQPTRVADNFSWEAMTGITRVTGVLHPSPMPASGHLSVKLTVPTRPCPIRVDNPAQALRRFRAP